MLQIDVLISYGLGGSIAVAASRQLREEPNPLLSRQALWSGSAMALLGAPTAAWMVSRHTQWETMQVFPDVGSIPPWLLAAFFLTMATQTLLGFWVTNWLMQKGRTYLANLNWMAGLFAAAFIVMYGWDGLAWDRFLYDSELAGGAPWQPGAGRRLGIGWLTSPSARSLLFVSLSIVVPTLWFLSRWAVEGARSDPSVPRDRVPTAGAVVLGFFELFGIALLTAATSAVTVHVVGRLIGHHILGYVFGLPLSFLLVSAFFRPGGVVHRATQRFAVICADASPPMSRASSRERQHAG